MGSLISLSVGKMEIDWGKNSYFRDHSALFTPEDIKHIPYYYVDYINDESKIIIEYKEGMSRKLSSIKKRLDLLGYTHKKITTMYCTAIEESASYGYGINLTFHEFANVIKNIRVDQIDTTIYAAEYQENGYDFGEFVRKCVLSEEEIFSKLIKIYGGDEYALKSELEVFFENLDPYIILRLLAENESCKELDVHWAFADILDNGWAHRDDIIKPLSDNQKILIVTEGTSDSYIIKKTIEELYPDISDFFKFIDMQKNYPFTGTGNLYNFCCGLMKIGIENKIIVIFDNDAAGNEKYEALMSMAQLPNLLITKLPDHFMFNSIDTIGPQGKTTENINGLAVAIECFLDFNSIDAEPIFRWTNYVEKMKKYQGSLSRKDDYVRVFKGANLKDGSYNVSKLKYLIEYLLEQWNNLN